MTEDQGYTPVRPNRPLSARDAPEVKEALLEQEESGGSLDGDVAENRSDIDQLYEMVEAMQSRLDDVEAWRDAVSQRLESQQAKLDAVASKATYNAVTGGGRKGERKKKVVSELHYQAEQDEDGRVSMDSEAIMEVADVSQQTASRYARQIAQEVRGISWVKPGHGWYTTGDGKRLRFDLDEFAGTNE